MNERLRPWLHNSITVLAWRLLIVYALLFLLRVIFYLLNTDTLGPMTRAEVPALVRGSLLFDTAGVCYCYCLFTVLSLLPLRARGRQWYRRLLFWTWLVPGIVIVLTNLADTVYFHYAKKRVTVDELHFADNDNTGHILWKAAGENWYLVLIAIVLVWGMVRLYRLVKPAPVRIRSGWAFVLTGSLMTLVSAVLLVGGMRGGLSHAIRPIAMSNAAQYALSPAKASVVLSNPFCILRTISNKKISYVRYFPDERELAARFSPCRYPAADSLRHDRFGTQRGKNILIFVLESFSYEHSAYLNPELYKGEASYTPFLDSLMREGYLFRRGYANGRKSIDALPSVLSSIPSFKTPFVVTPQSLGETRGLGRLLGEEGYSTWFFNGSENKSMGFVAYAKLSGVENARTREDYEAKMGRRDYDGYWGIWDGPFMQYMARELDTVPKPFFATIFTLSSHHPFVVPEGYENMLPEGRTKVQRPVAYTDRSLRDFFDYARRQPWYENTLFVFTADHVSSEVYGDESKAPTGNSHIIFFLYTPDGSLRGDDPHVAQQIDLMPTLLGLTGYDKPYFAYGQDIFEIRADSARVSERAFAINYLNESFQWITDSTAMFFDEHEVTHLFDLERDPLERHNLIEQGAEPDTAQVERMKALLQTYYERLEKSDFVVR
ncbi:LTA synthase family protein [Rikenella microfusus]|uniref:Lipoteichoic acid synthase 1 n=1 Tax=Rikenella microfusus TaxID=28139 RepID=A0A379MRG3_9BACT|nr:alkaline phosphatase family protein [Rikenella microfusus]SUE33212.1 Lipoteichoic acid synthase 1 [Rikenella microfusus]